MVSGFHLDYVDSILGAIVKYAAAGTRTYNSSNALIIAADPWIALLTADWTSSVNLSASEVSGGTYGRQQAVFSTPSGGVTDNDANIDFTLMPACTVHSVALCATTTEGTDDAIIGGDLTAEKTCNAGDTFRIAAADLDITLT